jgi:type I restriction enzyme S subunit
MSHVKLGDLFRVGSSKRVLQSQWTTEGIPFYRGREITKLSESGFVENDLFITEELFKDLSQRSGVPQAGDLMITAIGTIGNSYIVCPDDRFYFKDASVLWLARNSDVSSEYINHWLKSPLFLDQLDRGNGATVDTLTIQKLQGVLVHVPSASEQRRIVTLLDEAFADIATAKANAEKNLQNARELFNSKLDAIVVHAQENGEVVALSELATDITDGDHMPPPKVQHGLPFITIGNIDKQTRTIDFSDTFKVPREYFDALKANKRPMRGDVLYTVTGSFGIPVLVEDDAEFCFQRHIGLIRPKADVDSTWLHYLLQSPQVFKQAADGATGTAQKTVSLKVLRNLQVPRISLKAQSAHVETLRSVEAECRRLESIYRQKLTALDDLKKSLLHQAFSGLL